jgi:5-methylcytosine-specific restriction endonuclease McrA
MTDSNRTKRPIRLRNVPLNIRLTVLKRDGFRFVLCGRNPAIEQGVVLHLDHILHFSKGGESTADNLRTLCEACNLGKRDQTDV